MSLISMCAETALQLNQPAVFAVISSANRFAQELLAICEETGKELLRRHDWGQLVRTTTYSSTPGTLPGDFERLTMGSPVRLGTTPIRGALSDAEMNLKRGAPASSPPRFMVRKPILEVAPAPSTPVTLEYVSSFWISAAGGSLQASFLADTDASLIPEDIMVLGMKWRWRRLKGRPFDDELAEFEAAVAYRMSVDRSIRQGAA
jgi:hypothetical protein